MHQVTKQYFLFAPWCTVMHRVTPSYYILFILYYLAKVTTSVMRFCYSVHHGASRCITVHHVASRCITVHFSRYPSHWCYFFMIIFKKSLFARHHGTGAVLVIQLRPFCFDNKGKCLQMPWDFLIYFSLKPRFSRESARYFERFFQTFSIYGHCCWHPACRHCQVGHVKLPTCIAFITDW